MQSPPASVLRTVHCSLLDDFLFVSVRLGTKCSLGPARWPGCEAVHSSTLMAIYIGTLRSRLAYHARPPLARSWLSRTKSVRLAQSIARELKERLALIATPHL